MQAFLQKIFIRWLTKGLFKAIDQDDILRIEGRTMFYKGKELDADAVMVLQEQAETLLKSRLWKMLESEIRGATQEQMYNAKSAPDLVASHTMLYNLNLIESKIVQISTHGNPGRKSG